MATMMRRLALRSASARHCGLRSALRAAPRHAPPPGVLGGAVASSLQPYALQQLAISSVTPSARTFATESTSASNFFDLAQALQAKETSTEGRVAAINALEVASAPDTAARERRALELVDSNALGSLLEFLRDNDAVEASDLLIPSFLALIRVSTESLLAQELLRLEAPRVVTLFLQSPDPRLQAAACLTLGNLALEPTGASAVSSPEVVDAALSVLSSPHEAIKRAALTCVANIAGSAQGQQQLVEAGGALLVGELLGDDHSDQLRSAAAFALGNMLSGRDIEAQDLLRESGALPTLVLLLSPAFAEEVNSSAAWAVHHGVHLNPASQTLVAEAGGLALLVQALTSSATESLQTNALLALESAVASHEENQSWCRDNGVAAALLQLQENEGEDLNANAKRTLKALLELLD